MVRPIRWGRVSDMSRITDVTREIHASAVCVWRPSFAVVDFRVGDTYYQFSRRPPRGRIDGVEHDRPRLLYRAMGAQDTKRRAIHGTIRPKNQRVRHCHHYSGME